MNDPIWSSDSLVAVTPSDATVYQPAIRQLYVGTGGDVVLKDINDNVVTFKNVSDGSYIGPCYIKSVMQATTASNIVGFV